MLELLIGVSARIECSHFRIECSHFQDSYETQCCFCSFHGDPLVPQSDNARGLLLTSCGV